MRRQHPGDRFIPSELGLERPTRRAVLKAATGWWLLEPRNWMWSLAWFVGLIVVLAFVTPLLRANGLADASGLVISPLIFGWWILFLWWQCGRLGRHVYAELRDRGHDVCRGCGYLREGMDSLAVCPECGVRSVPLTAPGAGR